MSLRPTPATNESAGPFRKVVGTKDRTTTYPDVAGREPYVKTYQVEMLECGHTGPILSPCGAKKRRRCWRCGYAVEQADINQA